MEFGEEVHDAIAAITDSVKIELGMEGSDGIIITDSVAIEVSKDANDILSTNDSISIAMEFGCDIRDDLATISDSIETQSGRENSDSVTLSDSVKTEISKGIDDSLLATDSLETVRNFNKIVNDTLSTSDSVQTTMEGDPFITIWTTASDGDSITLPLVAGFSYNCTVDWGDLGPTSTITSYDDADKVHTYALAGTYPVVITGTCEGWSFGNDPTSKDNIVEIVRWGSGTVGFKYLADGFLGCSYLSTVCDAPIILHNVSNKEFKLDGLFSGCSSLTPVPASIFSYVTSITSLNYIFKDCTSIPSIPSNLFQYNTKLVRLDFAFAGCSSLSSIPSDLLSYCPDLCALTSVFEGCTALTSIGSSSLFSNNRKITAFQNTFRDCTGITSIPDYLFSNNVQVKSFEGAFRGTGITDIPSLLFAQNYKVSTFKFTFAECEDLETVGSDLFRRCTSSISSFEYVFYGCTKLATLPASLFRYNKVWYVLSFAHAFENCPKLRLAADLFYTNGEQATRFDNQDVSFRSSFVRGSFTGSQGTAQDLWNCTYRGAGSGSIKTDCFDGDGNSLASITNYEDIPDEWK
jgi:hypothetical protein